MKPTRTNWQAWDNDRSAYVGVYVLPVVCPYHILKGPLAKRAAGLNAIRVDLHECLNNLKYLKEQIDNSYLPSFIKKSLYFYSVILYIKCYNSSEGRGTRLESKEVFKALDELKLFHDKTWDLRDTYLAHAGVNDNETREMVAVLNPDINDKKVLDTQYSSLQLANDDSNIDNYITIVEASLDYTHKSLDKLQPKFKEEVLALDIEEVYEDSVLPKENDIVQIPQNPNF